ncbi:MAG: RICIN domain-containing protein, partial [Proteobacteria bacterium]|nr:RICIN domain-containing protein [Pseudomonadota bacterium]
GLHENTKRLIRIGGFAAPYNFNTHKIAPLIEEHLDVVEQTPYLPGVSFGTDMSGLGDQPAPRDDAETNPLNYPFTTEHGLTFYKQISGNRTFDLNRDGVAHYGLVADHVQDIREQASPRVYESIMNSAEAYLQMWERALQHTNTDYVNPLELFVKIVNRKDSRCMDINGRDDNLVNGANVQLWGCDDRSYDQQWFYNKQNQMFENRADRSKCLDNRGQAYNGGEIVIWDCVDSDNLRWTYDVNKLASKHDNNIVADAYNTVQGGNVGQWERHSGVWQEWELRPTRAIHTWVDFRSKSSGKCLDVTGGAVANGTKVQVFTCNGTAAQQWFFDPIKGTLKSKLPGNKCLDVPAGQTNNGTELQIWDCQAGNMNQQFDKNGNVFRPRLNTNKTLDATGSDRVVLWEYHGRDNQRWRPGIN